MKVKKIQKAKEKNAMLMRMLSIFLGLAALAALFWMGYSWRLTVHPGISTAVANTDLQRMNLPERIDNFAQNGKADSLNSYLAENQVIRKIYRIEEGAPVPSPNESCFGEVTPEEVDVVMDVIEAARESGLLEGQDLVFSPDADFVRNSKIYYYYDESILVINWRQNYGSDRLTLSEIKIGDGSQFRRKIADDTYGSAKQYFCSDFDKQIEAVVCMNADFYSFRAQGITCYEGEIHRFERSLDTLFIDENGDFLFYHRGTDTTKEEMQQFVDDNRVKFSLSFGPVLVENGELQTVSNYPIGQPLEDYSRAGIGQMDERHYLYASLAYLNADNPGATMQTFGNVMYELGAWQAYNLDGGQTAELYFHGKILNYLDFSNERTVSDVIYFSTAIPEEEQ